MATPPDNTTPEEWQHELDDRLAGASMFAWYGPTFRLAFKHWPLCLMAGLAAMGLEWLFARMPWPYGGYGWEQLLIGYVETVTYALVVAAGYRFLVERERVGTVNEWPAIFLRVVKIQTIWVAAAYAIVGGLALLALASGFSARPDSIADMVAWGWVSLLISIVMFLLMPVWFSLLVATVLSQVYAVRSAERGWGAVQVSLRLAFDQQWRVFWPSYVLVILVIVASVVVGVIGVFLPFSVVMFFAALGKIAPRRSRYR